MLQYYAATFPKIYYLMKAKMEKINILILTSSVVCRTLLCFVLLAYNIYLVVFYNFSACMKDIWLPSTEEMF